MAAAWHDWGDNLIWIGLIVGAGESLRRLVRGGIRKARKVIAWFKDKQEEDRATARAVMAVQQHLMTNNGGSTLLDKVDGLVKDVAEIKQTIAVIPQLEEIVTKPTKGHPYS